MSTTKVMLLIVGILLGVGLLAVGLMTALGYQMGRGFIGEARVERAEMDLNTLKLALLSYERANLSRLPTQEQGIRALLERPSTEPVPSKWRPMLDGEESLLDPWGNPYQYRLPAVKSDSKFDLWSHGPDGVESEDDIGNW